MKKKLALFFLAFTAFLPLFWRIAGQGFTEPVGLLSDTATGLTVFLLALALPHLLRIPVMLVWILCQYVSQELLIAMQRLPAWQDLHYLIDSDFVENTTAGFSLAEPVLALLFLLALLGLALVPARRPRWSWLGGGLLLVLPLFAGQAILNRQDDSAGMAARYNGLHWFIRDGIVSSFLQDKDAAPVSLPPGLNELDLSGDSLLVGGTGNAKNILLIVLEGIPGLYYPEIRKAMGVNLTAADLQGREARAIDLSRLAATTPKAMLIPDFTAHSHQTIRGLYALLCGDYSKLSWSTPKAFELQGNPERAQECLPAVLDGQGWSTHFLQGAGLAFMGKDRVMPLIGFQQVHGSEWFTERNPYPFAWGAIDEVFFRGAYRYIKTLRTKKQPWMLTLLTVGTHQPYAVPDAIASRYSSRKLATVALLDRAAADFIKKLRADGTLKDTLVIITSDESHGSDFGDWTSSWGLGLVLAPGVDVLPRLKQGGYGLVDVEASVLDYLGIMPPPNIIGRSFFRNYQTPREMLAYTASKRRWHTAGNLRYECADDGLCRVGHTESLLGPLGPGLEPDDTGQGQQVFAFADVLDRKLTAANQGDLTLHFGSGQVRKLPQQVRDEWIDNISSAQYLDFPAGTRVRAFIRLKALAAPKDGLRFRLALKTSERAVSGIAVPEFPVLRKGEEARVEFSFDNPEARNNFSFHLLGEGKNGSVRIEDFDVTVEKMGQNSNPANRTRMEEQAAGG